MDLLVSVTTALLVLLVAVGAGLTWGARPGRRRGTEPHCRACDYDLRGGTAGRCPECGADVVSAQGIVRGARLRRPGQLAAGLTLVTIGLTPVILARAGVWGAPQLYPYVPTALLLRDVQGTEPAARWAAGELERRFVRGRLTPAQCMNVRHIAATRRAPTSGPDVTATILQSLGAHMAAANVPRAAPPP